MTKKPMTRWRTKKGGSESLALNGDADMAAYFQRVNKEKYFIVNKIKRRKSKNAKLFRV